MTMIHLLRQETDNSWVFYPYPHSTLAYAIDFVFDNYNYNQSSRNKWRSIERSERAHFVSVLSIIPVSYGVLDTVIADDYSVSYPQYCIQTVDPERHDRVLGKYL